MSLADMGMCVWQKYFARNFCNCTSYNQTIQRTKMETELKKLQIDVAKELLTDEKFIEATLQAFKDMRIEIEKPFRIAVG